jgi:hypothetical protein
MSKYNIKKLEDLYFTQLWNYFETNNLLVYVVNNNNRLQVLNKKDKYLIEVTGYTNGIENSLHQEAIKKTLITNKELLEKELIVEYGRSKYWKINGFNNLDEFVINFYKNLSKEQIPLFGALLKKIYFKINYNINNKFLDRINLFLNNLSLEQFKLLWSLLPNNIIEITKYSEVITDILGFIKTKIIKEDQHYFLYTFLSHNSSMINRSEKKRLEIRDLLIKEYNYNKELLQDYKHIFPILKIYLDSNENKDSDYLEERFVKENFYIEINFEKMKAILAIPKYDNDKYKIWIDLLLNKIFKENKEINSIKSFSEKDRYRKQEYLIIHITKHIKDGIKKEDVEEYIKSFLKCISNDYMNIGYKLNERNYYIEKWYSMHSLNISLVKKDKKDLEQTIKKI